MTSNPVGEPRVEDTRWRGAVTPERVADTLKLAERTFAREGEWVNSELMALAREYIALAEDWQQQKEALRCIGPNAELVTKWGGLGEPAAEGEGERRKESVRTDCVGGGSPNLNLDAIEQRWAETGFEEAPRDVLALVAEVRQLRQRLTLLNHGGTREQALRRAENAERRVEQLEEALRRLGSTEAMVGFAFDARHTHLSTLLREMQLRGEYAREALKGKA